MNNKTMNNTESLSNWTYWMSRANDLCIPQRPLYWSAIGAGVAR